MDLVFLAVIVLGLLAIAIVAPLVVTFLLVNLVQTVNLPDGWLPLRGVWLRTLLQFTLIGGLIAYYAWGVWAISQIHIGC